MQQILSNEKSFFWQRHVKHLRIPLWPELSVQRIWEQAVRLGNFRAYMPDEWNGNSKTERTFFWDILTTLAPEYVEELVKDCRRQRLGMAAARNAEPR